MSGLSCNEALMQSFAREDALGDAFDRLLLKVEQLERDLGLADNQGREWEYHCKNAEAKLAKAVEAIKDLQATCNPATISKLELELRRIQRLGGFDAIIPAEGIVFVYGGHTYKMTGAFAPVNQLLGVLKYAR
jgi:hypothetical protein